MTGAAVCTATITPAGVASSNGMVIGCQTLGSGEGIILIGGTCMSAPSSPARSPSRRSSRGLRERQPLQRGICHA